MWFNCRKEGEGKYKFANKLFSRYTMWELKSSWDDKRQKIQSTCWKEIVTQFKYQVYWCWCVGGERENSLVQGKQSQSLRKFLERSSKAFSNILLMFHESFKQFISRQKARIDFKLWTFHKRKFLGKQFENFLLAQVLNSLFRNIPRYNFTVPEKKYLKYHGKALNGNLKANCLVFSEHKGKPTKLKLTIFDTKIFSVERTQ